MRRITQSAIVAVATIMGGLSLAIQQPVHAQASCQCTTYVASRMRLSQDYPNAGDWNNGYLQRNGFTQVSPEPGAIAVMERNFPGSDSTYGHVGVVESITNGKVTLRGANQWVGGSYFNEAGCNNVRLTAFGTNVNGNSAISFWKRGATPANTSIRLVKFSGTAADSGVNIRSGPSTTNAIVGRLNPKQQVNFDAWTYGSVVNDLWLGTPDARWYRIAGTNNWVASAVIYGNAPGSTPIP
jgi:surface antigen